MIDRQEIMDMAREFALAPNVVEKDYVLGWILAGIAAHPALAHSWIFKGGTCLKKCYFETYRFSEDLDFTLTDASHLDEQFLLDTFGEISEWILDQSGIEMPRETLRFEIFDNPRGNPSCQGRAGYRGPLARRGDAPRIKLDISPDEILVLEPAVREVNHPYSDKPEAGINVRCYAFEEVFAEKVRALAERERPRDLYDVVHLHRHDELQPDRNVIFTTLQRKCEFKSIDVPTYEQLAGSPNRPELEAEWENMLAHQLPVLPPFEGFWSALPEVFDWLHGTIEKPVRPVASVAGAGAVNTSWQPPAMGRAWNVAVPLEAIRFAAANRLCVAMKYRRKDGATKDYLIEPYSLRMSGDGNLLLYAVKHGTGDVRAFLVDRILNVEATKTSFVPRFQIELTPAGPISAPPTSHGQSLMGGYMRPLQRTRQTRTGTKRSRGGFSTSGPRHVFECPACGKKFTRKAYDAALNPHKNKEGWPCYGRYGTFVETKY